ncbi:MAG: hypothetical protein U1E46_17615 [Hyphomicrobiales bacterium]
MRLIRSFCLAAAFAVSLPTLLPHGAAIAAEAAGPVLVTVAGAVEKANRGPMDPFADGFLNANNHAFQKARTFTFADLAALPQVEITAQAQSWAKPVVLKGVRLADLLAAAGASSGTVTLYALDNYGVKLDAKDLAAKDWVVGHSADGVPLAVGGRGPLWLAYDTAKSGPASKEEEGQWVWAVYLITVE